MELADAPWHNFIGDILKNIFSTQNYFRNFTMAIEISTGPIFPPCAPILPFSKNIKMCSFDRRSFQNPLIVDMGPYQHLIWPKTTFSKYCQIFIMSRFLSFSLPMEKMQTFSAIHVL